MIKADKASEITEQAYTKKHDELLQYIDAMIMKAAKEGQSSCSINDSEYFDDTIEHELHAAGYDIDYRRSMYGDLYKISWSDNKC